MGRARPLGPPRGRHGGISLAAWNYIRATRAVDLLIAVDQPSVDPILAALQAHGCRPKRTPPVLAVGDHHFVQFVYTPPGEFYDVQFDLLLAESALQTSAIARRVRRDVPGVGRPIDVLSCDDLILFKLLAGRLIDRADAAMLLRENCEEIDFEYFLSWVAQLGLTTEFSECWREACLNVALPTLARLPSWPQR